MNNLHKIIEKITIERNKKHILEMYKPSNDVLKRRASDRENARKDRRKLRWNE